MTPERRAEIRSRGQGVCSDCGKWTCIHREDMIDELLDALDTAEGEVERLGRLERQHNEYANETAQESIRIREESEKDYERLIAALKHAAELKRERHVALRIGYEVTLETQSLEEMTTELVRLVRQAREERDAALKG